MISPRTPRWRMARPKGGTLARLFEVSERERQEFYEKIQKKILPATVSGTPEQGTLETGIPTEGIPTEGIAEIGIPENGSPKIDGSTPREEPHPLSSSER